MKKNITSLLAAILFSSIAAINCKASTTSSYCIAYTSQNSGSLYQTIDIAAFTVFSNGTAVFTARPYSGSSYSGTAIYSKKYKDWVLYDGSYNVLGYAFLSTNPGYYYNSNALYLGKIITP